MRDQYDCGTGYECVLALAQAYSSAGEVEGCERLLPGYRVATVGLEATGPLGPEASILVRIGDYRFVHI